MVFVLCSIRHGQHVCYRGIAVRRCLDKAAYVGFEQNTWRDGSGANDFDDAGKEAAVSIGWKLGQRGCNLSDVDGLFNVPKVAQRFIATSFLNGCMPGFPWLSLQL
jgi:hypothetical protein